MIAQRLERARLDVDERSAAGDQLVHVDPLEAPAELALEATVEDRLDERSDPPGVARRDEVDRRAQECEPDDGPIGDQVRQLVRAKGGKASPQTDVRGVRRLGLQGHELLDHLGRGAVRALEQRLAGERGAVQRLAGQHGPGMMTEPPGPRRVIRDDLPRLIRTT